MDDLTESFSRASVSNRSSRKRPLMFECSVCFCSLYSDQTYDTGDCRHHLCLECIRTYIKEDVNNNWQGYSQTKIPCVDIYCIYDYDFEQVLERCFSPEEAEELRLLAISKVHVKNKVTCPTDNCNATFDADFESTKKCTFDSCPECHRGLCLACQTVWHPGTIRVYNDEKEERKILNYAYDNHWARCPDCGHVVQKSYGCDTISCVCGAYFCYRCGEPCPHGHIFQCYYAPGQEVVNKRRKMFSVPDKKKPHLEPNPEARRDTSSINRYFRPLKITQQPDKSYVLKPL